MQAARRNDGDFLSLSNPEAFLNRIVILQPRFVGGYESLEEVIFRVTIQKASTARNALVFVAVAEIVRNDTGLFL
jgi:hypothetical protein